MALGERSHDRWLWIELIGFDNESPDLGVGDLLARTGFAPQAVSLLFFTPDFVHTHAGMADEHVLPPDQCAYCARPLGRERKRQAWTNWQLKRLVEALHARGVAVYCSFFNLFSSTVDGQFHQSPWCAAHPEMWETRRNGDRAAMLCPLKRMADGIEYEAFFVPQLVQVMDDYGFDGYHGADGYSSTRLPLNEIDYSDDMVDQWRRASGVELPDSLRGPCEKDPARCEERAAWIWANQRESWLEFWAERFAGFWSLVTSALHAKGKRVVLNSGWTRDPFQAAYRYGADYQRLARAGVDGFVVETVSAGVSIGAEGILTDPRYDYQAMLLLMKGYTPDVPLMCLNGTQDTCEQWDVLRHAPTASEREILSLSSLFLRRADGSLTRCSSGPVVCLSDGIAAHEWQWLSDRWELGFAYRPTRTIGPTLVWSDAAHQAQLADYIATRRWTVHKTVYELMAANAPIRTIARAEDLSGVTGPLLVVNPHLWPADELVRVRNYTGGPVMAIGGRTGALPAEAIVAEDGPDSMALVCWVLGGAASPPAAVGDGPGNVGWPTAPDPVTFLEELPYRAVSAQFVQACARLIVQLSEAVEVVGRADVTRAWAVDLGEIQRLFITNDSHYYAAAEVDLHRPIESVAVATCFPGMPVMPNGSRITVRVPPRGIVALDVR
ncbi:MAG TPA: hypothetical protein PLD23_07610 [Armatimonadota bacterium]|nr:hypothetical protein [Armatimonadota bacterium]HQK93356.1 hypothetical protein [Armatimonadota bacterium]